MPPDFELELDLLDHYTFLKAGFGEVFGVGFGPKIDQISIQI